MLNFLRKTALWVLLLPYAVYGVGAASNQLVLIANHDKFPAMINQAKIDKFNAAVDAANLAGIPEVPSRLDYVEGGMIDDIHCVMTSKTHLNFLADIFDTHDMIYSVGDGLLFLGKWLATFCPFIWGFALMEKVRKA